MKVIFNRPLQIWEWTSSSNIASEGDQHVTILRFSRDAKGATAIEYGLIAALIAVAAVSAMSALGDKLSTTFNNVNSNMKAT